MTARRRPVRTVRAVAAATAAGAAAVLLGGCGVLPGTAEASDDAVTVMTWAPQGTSATNMPGMPAMAQAYARWVNTGGGIAGHRLTVLTCNDHNDSTGARRCAEKADDADAVAVVGSYSQMGRSFMSTLEMAGIPYIGGFGVTDDEFNSPLSYPVNGGLPALIAGNGRQLAAGDCSSVSLVRPDTTAGDQLPDLFDAGLAEGGAGHAGPATDVRAPEDASDYTEDAEQALAAVAPGTGTGAGAGLGAGAGAGARAGSGAGGGRPCVSAVLGGHTGTFFDSFRRLPGHEGVRTASVLGSLQQSLVDRSGGSDSPLEGAYATSWYPVAGDSRWDTMKHVIREHAFGDNRVEADDPGVQTTWIAYTVLRDVVEGLGDKPVTARSVRRALDQGGGFETGGLTPKLDWSFQNMLAARDFPRIVNTKVTYQRVRDGRLASVHDGFVDVEKTLERGASASEN